MVLKSKVIAQFAYTDVQVELDKFLAEIQPEQLKAIAVDNGICWVVWDDQAPNRLASLNKHRVSKQPIGDPTVNDHPKNTSTWIDNSCTM